MAADGATTVQTTPDSQSIRQAGCHLAGCCGRGCGGGDGNARTPEASSGASEYPIGDLGIPVPPVRHQRPQSRPGPANVFEAIQRHAGFAPRPAACRTEAMPGTREKVEVMAARAERGEDLWHPDDPVIEWDLEALEFFRV